MGTYTTNYQLYTPTIGETGWGTLVNGNFTTIDTTMKSLSNRIAAVENEVNGALSCTSVTTSGKITGNGGIAGTTGTFSGVVSASKYSITSPMTVTVTPHSTIKFDLGSDDVESTDVIMILPPNPFFIYTGGLTITSANNSYGAYYAVYTDKDKTTSYMGNNTMVNINFTGVKFVAIANKYHGSTSDNDTFVYVSAPVLTL